MTHDSCTYCPHCGEVISTDLDTVSSPCNQFVVRGQEVWINGQGKRFRGSQCKILKNLAAAWGRVVTKETLYFSMYSLISDDEQPCFKVIDVFVCQIRRELAGTGFRIRTIWGGGYVLEAGEQLFSGKPTSKPWSAKEEGKLATEFGRKPTRDIARELGRTSAAVLSKHNRMEGTV